MFVRGTSMAVAPRAHSGRVARIVRATAFGSLRSRYNLFTTPRFTMLTTSTRMFAAELVDAGSALTLLITGAIGPQTTRCIWLARVRYGRVLALGLLLCRRRLRRTRTAAPLGCPAVPYDDSGAGAGSCGGCPRPWIVIARGATGATRRFVMRTWFTAGRGGLLCHVRKQTAGEKQPKPSHTIGPT